MMDQFFHDMITPALELDSLVTSHPISVDVRDPKEIEAIFDAISYKKGASVIHMLEDTVGEDVLRAGLSRYLKAHKFGNAVTDDLWTAISREWDRDKEGWHNFTVKEMMDTWTLQMGYPLVTFERVEGASGKRYVIKQQRFYKSMNVSCALSQIFKHDA
jgi:aminopeptidase N